MERILVRPYFVIFFLTFFSSISFAQEVTGIWRGYFITDGGEQYKLEFQVKQNGGASVEGVSYSYLDVRFYGKATMTGTFNKEEKKFKIQELRTVEVRNLAGSGTCIMNYSFTYSTSGKEEFLEGTFLGKTEDRKNPKNNGEWGDCGGGTVYLRKVPTSDFYVEPFLRDKVEPKKDTSAFIKKIITEPAKKITTKTNPVKKPIVKTTPVTKPPIKNTTTTKPVVKKTEPIKKPITKTTTVKTDTTRRTVTQTTIKKEISVPNVLKSRENALAQAITVNTDSITIKLYDNGEIDGDTISVYVDKKLVLSNKGLSASPIVLPLKFGTNGEEHEVIMVAENLGRIPPNTSLMIITAGDKRYQVHITSTEQKNAMVRFRYSKPS